MEVAEALNGHVSFASPLGELTLVGRGETLVGLYFPGHTPAPAVAFGPPAPDALVGARRQLEEYFSGRRASFELALDPPGTLFQRAAWAQMQRIPYGRTRTYGELAQALAVSRGSAHPRAVGTASAHNPISIVIPCHRMVGATGSLAGYAGGLERKRALLDHERRTAAAAFAAADRPIVRPGLPAVDRDH